MNTQANDEIAAFFRIVKRDPDSMTFAIEGRLDSRTTGRIWHETMGTLDRAGSPPRLILDAEQLDYCDGSGIGLLLEIGRRQETAGGDFQIRGLKEPFQKLLDLFDPGELTDSRGGPSQDRKFVEEIGRATARVWLDIQDLIAFVGELAVALATTLFRPRRVRWNDALRVAETAGVNALPIVALISFLMGLIMAFQAAIPMRQFGVEIFVADLVALSMLRELGPLMTGIILAGRSGSAFAAELGTMKVNEEIDALTTMGLDPVKFLVVGRVMATVLMTPLLVIFSDLLGLMGGSVVLLSLGYPLITYFNEILTAVTFVDLLGGLVKSLVFGLLAAGIGCLRGLQTKSGASAVGASTTRAVVTGIILIIVTDGIFSVVYYYLGV